MLPLLLQWIAAPSSSALVPTHQWFDEVNFAWIELFRAEVVEFVCRRVSLPQPEEEKHLQRVSRILPTHQWLIYVFHEFLKANLGFLPHSP